GHLVGAGSAVNGRELPDSDLVGDLDAARLAMEATVHRLAADDGVGANDTASTYRGTSMQHGADEKFGAAAYLDAGLYHYAVADLDVVGDPRRGVDHRGRAGAAHVLAAVDEGESGFCGDLFADHGAR